MLVIVIVNIVRIFHFFSFTPHLNLNIFGSYVYNQNTIYSGNKNFLRYQDTSLCMTPWVPGESCTVRNPSHKNKFYPYIKYDTKVISIAMLCGCCITRHRKIQKETLLSNSGQRSRTAQETQQY